QHLLQNDLEQGAFLFATVSEAGGGLHLDVVDHYLVPAEGWEAQEDVFLKMADSERAKIMQIARAKGLAAIDCHSHPMSDADVWFSASDRIGIRDFAQYAR